MDPKSVTHAQAVTVSLKELLDGELSTLFGGNLGWPQIKKKKKRRKGSRSRVSEHKFANFVMYCPGTVSFETLSEAFGPSSLGIIVVKDLPPKFKDLRAQVLSNASYLAALPEEELGKIK